MKKLFFLLPLMAAFACGGNNLTPTPEPAPTPDPPTPDPPAPVVNTFAKGADISWASEMEAGGVKFKKKDGTEAALLDVLKDCGFNAVRLRVWVNPYGGWSGKEDVLAVAQKVKAAGLDLMIDFHYSDFFADPSRQKIPADWEADKDNLDKLCQRVSAHTKDVLQALKDKGVSVKWVQMHFARLYNAGYDAVKGVYAEAVVMPHLNNAYEDNAWWFTQMKAEGAKFDAIALSHYPQAENKYTAAQYNQKALDQIKALISAFGVPVFVAEVGVKLAASDAASVLSSFMTEVRKIEKCAGVFYWEPQVNGSWKPEIYSKPAELSKYTGESITSPWGPYDQGAFTADYRPSPILDCFAK